MKRGGFKAGITDLEKKFLLFLGLCALLAGMGILGQQHDGGSLAPLLILIGLFGVFLSAVKQRRIQS